MTTYTYYTVNGDLAPGYTARAGNTDVKIEAPLPMDVAQIKEAARLATLAARESRKFHYMRNGFNVFVHRN